MDKWRLNMKIKGNDAVMILEILLHMYILDDIYTKNTWGDKYINLFHHSNCYIYAYHTIWL